MKSKTQYTVIAVLAACALAACQGHAENHAAAKPATQRADDTARCSQFADSQLKGQPQVSGTTVSSSYNSITGFCTVKIENNQPGSSFFSKVSTNSFDPSTTSINLQAVQQPVHVVWHEEPAPTRLLCKSVTKLKNGQLDCTPYKSDPDTAFDPFADF